MKEKSIGLLIGLIVGLATGAGGYWMTASVLGQMHSTSATTTTLPHSMTVNTTNSLGITATVAAIQSYSNGSCVGSWSNLSQPSTQLSLTVSDPQTCAFSVVFASVYNYNVSVGGNVYTIGASAGSKVATINVNFVFTVREGPLGMDSYAFSSSTSATIYIRNAGTTSVNLTAYYVTDSSGNQWALTTWSGPSISPNSVVATTISIGSSCSICTYTGTSGAFTGFTSGFAYTIKVVTSRNNPFTFTITK